MSKRNEDTQKGVKRPKHRPADKQAYRLLQHIMVATATTMVHQPEEFTNLTAQLTSLNSAGRMLPLDDPNNLYRIMDFLRRSESPRMSELAQELAVSLSTATRLADALVATGYIDRVSDPSDRRLVRLVLTDQGIKAHDVIERYLLQITRKILNLLTPEEQNTFLTLSDKINARLRKETTESR